MKTKFRFKIIQNNKVKFKNFTFETPEFSVIPAGVHKNNGSENEFEFPSISIESQLIEWLDNYDKELFMIENNIDIIIDYFIPIVNKKVTFEELVKSIKWTSLEILNIFMWTYSQLKTHIYKLKPLNQIEITMLVAGLIIDGQTYIVKDHILIVEKILEDLKSITRKKLN